MLTHLSLFKKSHTRLSVLYHEQYITTHHTHHNCFHSLQGLGIVAATQSGVMKPMNMANKAITSNIHRSLTCICAVADRNISLRPGPAVNWWCHPSPCKWCWAVLHCPSTEPPMQPRQSAYHVATIATLYTIIPQFIQIFENLKKLSHLLEQLAFLPSLPSTAVKMRSDNYMW